MTNIRIESVYSHKSEGSITSIWEQYNSLRNWDKNNPHNYDMYSEFLFWADCELDNTKIIIIDKIQITNPENC